MGVFSMELIIERTRAHGIAGRVILSHAFCLGPLDPASVDPLIAALRTGDGRRLSELVYNRLEPAAERLSPGIGRLRGEFAKLGCVAAQMSGSGTSYFGVCRHAGHARRVVGALRSRGFERVYAVRTL